jgi:hypothetical protein
VASFAPLRSTQSTKANSRSCFTAMNASLGRGSGGWVLGLGWLRGVG